MHYNIYILKIYHQLRCMKDPICIKRIFAKVNLDQRILLFIVLISNKYEFIFTMSIDGYLKFWKKIYGGIEFVKTFRAHLGKITGCSLSSSEQRLATVSSKDSALKVFDVVNFDLMHMIKLKFVPDICEFIHKESSFSSVIAISE